MTELLPAGRREPAQAALADRGLVLARAVAGLVHEGKNPLHNMALHLQLVSEKIAQLSNGVPAAPLKGLTIDRHLQAMRDGIARIDHLLRSFGELAEPPRGRGDLAEAAGRAVLILGFEARRRRVEISCAGPTALPVEGGAAALSDLVAHAVLAFIWLANDGGRVTIEWSHEPGRALLSFRAAGGVGVRSEAEPHLAAVRRLAAEGAGELLIETEAGGQADARLSLHMPAPT